MGYIINNLQSADVSENWKSVLFLRETYDYVIIIYSNTFVVNMKDYYDELVDGIGYPIFG